MKEGIQFIRQRDGMSALVVLAFCTTLFGFSLNGFLPVFVRNIFHRGPETYTLLLVSSGAGSICGASDRSGHGKDERSGPPDAVDLDLAWN